MNERVDIEQVERNKLVDLWKMASAICIIVEDMMAEEQLEKPFSEAQFMN